MRIVILMTLLLSACQSPESGPPWVAPEARVFTPDLVSSFEAWDPTTGGAGTWDEATDVQLTRPAFAVYVSSFELPPEDGSMGPGHRPDSFLEAQMQVQLLGGLALFRMDDGSRVEADARHGCLDLTGEVVCGSSDGYFVSLVPREPLSEGWYLFRADFSVLNGYGIHVTFDQARHADEVAYARVHVGSLPAVSSIRIERDDVNSTTHFTALLTERIPTELQATSRLAVEFDGAPADCELTSDALAFRAACPLPPIDATVRARLDGESIPDVEGTFAREVEIPAAGLYESDDGVVRMDVVPAFGLDLLD